MGREDRLPGNVIVAEEAVSRHRLRPVRTRPRDTRRRSRRKRIQQRDRSFVPTAITQVDSIQFLLSPPRHDAFSRKNDSLQTKPKVVYKAMA